MEEEEESKQLNSLPAGLQLVHVPVVLPYPDQNCCWSWAFVAAVPRTKIDLNIIENRPAIICSCKSKAKLPRQLGHCDALRPHTGSRHT
jgi:hypothetical protein